MDRTCVYSILAVLFIAVHSSMAFLLNIHEKMTRAERLAVFGSEDSVPEYEVFSMSLPRARRRREAGKNINLELEIDGRKITLDLKPISTYLATKHTPVWLAESDEHAFENIRYNPLAKAMSDIGQFKMYHDVQNEAAITVYESPSKESIMEGIVTAYYAIRSLPKRLIGEVLRKGGRDYLVDTPAWSKRSVISDTEEDKGYYVVFKIPNASKDVQSRSLVDPDYHRRGKRARNKAGKREVPTAVYPEILIVLDHKAMSEHSFIEVLRFTLAFWNGVDLIYRTLDNPKVYLNIAGIIIAGNTSTTPYIAENVSSTQRVYANNVTPEMGKYFYKERVRFPMNRYDIIIAMTTLELYLLNADLKLPVDGYNAPDAQACSSTPEASKTKIIGNTGIIHYWWEFSGVRTAAQITAHLFGVNKDLADGIAADCASEKGYIMSESVGIMNRKMQWSNCSRRDFSRHFSSKKSVCVQNKPLWIKQVGKVLPGRWLTVDGQCRNEGYAKACKLKKLSTCAAKGCQAKGSGKCVRTKRAPLPGSTCGTNKHCSTKKKCVRD